METRILLIDDDPSQLRLTTRWLAREGWHVDCRANASDGLKALTGTLPDVIVLDLYVGDDSGLQVLSKIMEHHPDIPVVMLTSETSVDIVVNAMQRGAYDYLTKPMTRTKLVTTIRNAIEKRRLAVRLRQLEREASGSGFGPLIGQSSAMRHLFRQMDRVAPSDVTVLLQGESGTGKELVARALHQGSKRGNGPFVAINCAAIPESLQESELFGHEKGAFTGAIGRRKGRFEQADNGTLFLDEVGELSPALQAKLLRVLQERSFYRIGGDQEISVDVRIIAATHQDLESHVQSGRFRVDLFYRLAVYELSLPPLREREGDIDRLADHLLELHCQKNGRELQLSAEARQLLRGYHWPGNVRELENAMARAIVASEGPEVTPDDLPPRIRATRMPRLGQVLRPMENMERQAIVEAIDASDGNLSEVMRRLGIPRTTFYRRLKKYGIEA